MYKNHLSYIVAITLFTTLLLQVGCKNFDEPIWEENPSDTANISISDLHAMVAERGVVIEDDIIIGGYVTTSDEASNFHRTFIIEDASGGAEIMAGLYDLHNIYPIGYYVTINLKGCAIGEHLGVMQIGMPAEEYSYYTTDYFSSRVILDQHIKRHNLKHDITPLPLSISDLRESQCGRLVNIGNITPAQDGVWSGYQLFSDNTGQTIAVYTSEYASYSQKALPSGAVIITGILQYGKVNGQECYIIKMRNEKDCSSNN